MKIGEIKGNRLFTGGRTKVISYSELCEMYFKSLEVKGRAKETLITYKQHHKYFLKFLKEYSEKKNPTTDLINLECFEIYVRYMQEVKEINNHVTLNSYMQNISPLIKWGYERGYIKNDFKMPYLKTQEKFKEIYTEDELNTLLKSPHKKNFVDVRNWAIIWTLASTGIRAKELRNLKVGNVDLINRGITVNTTKNKKARVIPISTALYEVLTEYMEGRLGEHEDYLFPTVFNQMMERTTLQKHIKQYCNRRGVEKCGIHLFRHTFITLAVRTNISPLLLKRVTGHSTLKELNRYYQANVKDLLSVIDNITPGRTSKKNLFK